MAKMFLQSLDFGTVATHAGKTCRFLLRKHKLGFQNQDLVTELVIVSYLGPYSNNVVVSDWSKKVNCHRKILYNNIVIIVF